ncbi:MAG TPA: hypothetical protein VGX78_20905 [Pirellulales bacterium]|jgi:hypothetical protein|nr:hypothetical protein [Pirellulales bacterium]
MKQFVLIAALLGGLFASSATPALARPYRRPVARTAVRVTRPVAYRATRPAVYRRANAPSRGYGPRRGY